MSIIFGESQVSKKHVHELQISDVTMKKLQKRYILHLFLLHILMIKPVGHLMGLSEANDHWDIGCNRNASLVNKCKAE